MAKSTGSKKGKNSSKKLEYTLTKLLDPDCSECPVSDEAYEVCAPVVLPTEKHPEGKLIMVGQYLSDNEFLHLELERIGFNVREFFIASPIKCHSGDSRQPTDREIRICTDLYLSRELQAIQPRFGLAFGNDGIKSTLGRKGITKYNSTTYEYGNVTFVASISPSAVTKNPRYLDEFRAALLVFKRLVYDEEGVPQTRSIAVNDKQTLSDLIEALEGAKEGAIDIETWGEHKFGGLYPWDKDFRLSAINICVKPGLAYVIPLWTNGSRWKDPQKVIDILLPYLQLVPFWYMHNGKFDEKGMHPFGVDIRQTMDTMGAIYALDENNRKDLGFASQVYLGASPYKDMIDKKHTNLADLDDLVEYGGMDADYTLRIGKKLKKALKKEPMSAHLFWNLLMPAVNALTDIEIRGVPIHIGKFQSRRFETEENINDQVEIIQDFVPPDMRPFNPNSTQQLGRLLFRRLDFPVMEITKSGAPSTAEATLIRLNDLDDTGVIDAILEYRKWHNYMSRYFNNWADRMDSVNRLHTTFKPFHTVTGRLSSSDPNLQQVPRDHFIRGIIGGRKGWTIVEADYSQVELRIVAHISQDKTMLRAYHLGQDLHTETAMATTGLSQPEITSEIRKKAKAVNFGFVYGMGYHKFMDYCKSNYGIDVSEAEAKSYREAFFQNFRALRGWHERQRRAAKRRQWVVSPIGRKRHLWDINSQEQNIRAEAERQAINSPVQSMASDMMLMSMVALNNSLDPRVAKIIGSVHDSLLFEIRDEAVDDSVPQIVHIMENLPLEETFECSLTVPIVADIKVGRFWSEGATEL